MLVVIEVDYLLQTCSIYRQKISMDSLGGLIVFRSECLVFSCGIGWAGAGWRFAFGFAEGLLCGPEPVGIFAFA